MFAIQQNSTLLSTHEHLSSAGMLLLWRSCCWFYDQYMPCMASRALPRKSRAQPTASCHCSLESWGWCPHLHITTPLFAGPQIPTCWYQLPSEVLSAIFQHVPLQHRYSSCTLVSIAWAAAAAAVPVLDVSTSRKSAAALRATWDAQAARFRTQLTSFSLSSAENSTPARTQSAIWQLPCAQLKDLQLCNLAMQLQPDAAEDTADLALSTVPAAHASDQTAPGTAALAAADGPCHSSAGQHSSRQQQPVLSTMTGLTGLRLQDVHLLGQPHEHLTALAALTNLQHLSAQNIHHRRVERVNGPYLLQPQDPLLPDNVLPHVTALTFLQVDSESAPALSLAGLQQVSCLTKLQHLCTVYLTHGSALKMGKQQL